MGRCIWPMAHGPLGADNMHLFFTCFFSFVDFYWSFSSRGFYGFSYIFTCLDFLFEFKICSISIFFYNFRIFVQTRKLFKFEFLICSDSKIVQIQFCLYAKKSNSNFFCFKKCSNLKNVSD
jgi:hypothetical protein